MYVKAPPPSPKNTISKLKQPIFKNPLPPPPPPRTKSSFWFDHCDDITPEITLDKISLGTYSILYDNKVVRHRQTIGMGGFGKVYKYFDDNLYGKQVVFAIKYTQDHNEAEIVSKINVLKCNVIPAKIIGKVSYTELQKFISVEKFFDSEKETYIIALPFMSGTLQNIQQDIISSSLNRKVLLLTTIVKMLKCLHDKKYLYTDIKLENFLFRCSKKNVMTITLGDIGSIISTESKESYFVYTYSPPAKDILFDKSIMVWQLCVLCLEMFVFKRLEKTYTVGQMEILLKNYLPNNFSPVMIYILKNFKTISLEDIEKNLEFIYNELDETKCYDYADKSIIFQHENKLKNCMKQLEETKKQKESLDKDFIQSKFVFHEEKNKQQTELIRKLQERIKELENESRQKKLNEELTQRLKKLKRQRSSEMDLDLELGIDPI